MDPLTMGLMYGGGSLLSGLGGLLGSGTQAKAAGSAGQMGWLGAFLAAQAAQQGLIWTDLAVWAMQYIGQPYVYSFNEIGTGCGLVSRKAACSMNNGVYWMSQ